MMKPDGLTGRRRSKRGGRPVQAVVVDGGGVPAEEVLAAMRSGGLRVVAERTVAGEPWRMVQACTEKPDPPDLILVTDRAGVATSVEGQIDTARRLLKGIPLVVVTQREDPQRFQQYRELGAWRVLNRANARQLADIVPELLRKARHRGARGICASKGLKGPPQGALLRAAAELKDKLWRICDRIWIKDHDLKLIYANDVFARDVHMTPEELVGLTDCGLWGEETGEEFRRRDRQVMAQGRRVEEPGWRGTVTRKIPISDADGQSVALVLMRAVPDEDRRRMEEALYTVADLVVSSNDAITILDADGTIRSCNPAAANMYGYTEEELAGRSAADIAASGHREALLSDLRRAADDHETSRRESVHLTKGDAEVEVSVTVSPVLGPWGELLAVSMVARDISARKGVERALRHSEERFRLMAETAFDGMSIVELEPDSGREQLVFCNARYVEMSGHTESQLRQADDLRPLRATGPELASVQAVNMLRKEYVDPAYERQCSERLAEGLSVRELGSWNRPDGAENYHERSCVRVSLDGRHYLFSVDRDVTEALRRERELKETLEEMALFHGELDRLGYVGEARSERTEPHRAEIEQIARRLREDPVEDFDFRAAARRMNLSYGYFRRIFRQYMDRAPHDYLLLWRMRKAARLLREPDRLVKSVAREVGYTDRVQFSKLFKQKIGLSPTAYREALRRTQRARP
ncbi:MAG: PAS domain-containing protein [Candidatus Brocadiia bacterium]